jgi:hypothetical protein
MPGAALIHETGKLGKTWRHRRERTIFKRNGDSAYLFNRGQTRFWDDITYWDVRNYSFILFIRGLHCLLRCIVRMMLSRFVFD